MRQAGRGGAHLVEQTNLLDLPVQVVLLHVQGDGATKSGRRLLRTKNIHNEFQSFLFHWVIVVSAGTAQNILSAQIFFQQLKQNPCKMIVVLIMYLL